MDTPVICYGCGNQFTAMRVTASLKCARCGSDDLDLDDRQPHTAASPGTGWNQPRPNTLEGWAVQDGLHVDPNPLAGQKLDAGSNVCQACNGTGVDTRASGGGYNEVPCRNCHGTGVQATHADSPGTPNDTHAGPPVGGARYQASANPTSFTVEFGAAGGGATAGRKSTDPLGSPDEYIRSSDPDYDNRSGEPRVMPNRSPMVKVRQPHPYLHGNNPLPLPGATCPSCKKQDLHVHTQLVRDANNDAWWHCPNCGSLGNVDKNPEINPYAPGEDFEPDRKMATKVARFRRKKDTSKVLKMTRTVLQSNPGLTPGQALTLVRTALLTYPEGSN